MASPLQTRVEFLTVISTGVLQGGMDCFPVTAYKPTTVCCHLVDYLRSQWQHTIVPHRSNAARQLLQESKIYSPSGKFAERAK